MLSDDEILKNELNSIEKRKKEYLEIIEDKKNNLKKLNKILDDAIKYEPPTDDHLGYKNFMIDQLKNTIKWDCDIEYYENELKTNDERKKSLNVEDLKKEKLEEFKKDIEYYENRVTEDIERVEKGNQWVETVFMSLEKINN